MAGRRPRREPFSASPERAPRDREDATDERLRVLDTVPSEVCEPAGELLRVEEAFEELRTLRETVGYVQTGICASSHSTWPDWLHRWR